MMALDITIKQTGFLKKKLAFETIVGNLNYGSYNHGFCLDPGKVNNDNFIIYDKTTIARGISITWNKSDKNIITLQLLFPTTNEEIEQFYELINRIVSIWNKPIIIQDGNKIDVNSIPTQIINIKEFNLRTLKDFQTNQDETSITLFCAMNPISIGNIEKEQFCNTQNTNEFKTLLHKLQSIDAYFAVPRIYKTGNDYLGAFVISEDVDSIVPITPHAPFGIQNSEFKQHYIVNYWKVLLFSYTEDKIIGEITYEVFFNYIKNNSQYYDASNVLIKGLSLNKMYELINIQNNSN